MDENVEKFLTAAADSLADEGFVKLILSNYKGPDGGPQRISVRLIETRKGPRMMFQSRFETRDVVKNFEFAEGIDEVRRRLSEGFRNAHLFTTSADFQLDIGKRNSRLQTGKASVNTRPPATHNRKKRTLIDPNAFYLKALGIADDSGRIKTAQQDKWRQINKFVEILAGLIDSSPIRDKRELRIVDMGSGKGYLTFAAYDYFANVHAAKNNSTPYKVAEDRGGSLPDEDSALDDIDDGPGVGEQPLSGSKQSFRVQMTGVEARPELVDLCNDIAKAGGFEGLRFVSGQIADFEPGEMDVLIALHACDTATDDALFKGIAGNASIIVAAPCCHKELRKQITPPEMLTGVLKHGIMLERTAETITDGLRALILEREGYSTKLFEFVPTEHTPKNNMLTATRSSKNGSGAADKQIRDIASSFGIAHQRLVDLLKEDNR